MGHSKACASRQGTGPCDCGFDSMLHDGAGLAVVANDTTAASPKRQDGGPAFPQAQIAGADVPVDLADHGGMSLRDYFAAKAMQALIAANLNDTWSADVSKAYDIADAMLKERSK